MSSFRPQAVERVVMIPAGVAPLLKLENCADLSGAAFSMDGNDLLVTTEDAPCIRIADYYQVSHKPTLVDDNGLELTEGMVSSMVRQAFRFGTFQPFRPFDPGQNLAHTLREERSSPLLPVLPEAGDDIGSRILHVICGQTATITCDILPDSSGAVEIILVKQGTHGFLTADDLVLRSGDIFSYEDVEQGKVIYYHDESNSQTDTLQLRYNGCEEQAPVAIKVAIAGH